MQHYMIPIGTAFLVFPLIAIVFTIPYIIYQYRKFGSILFSKTAIVYSFILYLLVAYFLVILPLPPIDEVAKLTTPTVQLVPFTFVTDFLEKSGFVWNQISTYWTAITSSSFYNVIFNIFLTVPFAIYLRYYFGCSKWKTIFCTFLLSLFFELTQLSALYGIYPRPYRLFDVDDLLTNTLGGVVGYFITPLICFLLPSKNEIDKKALKKGEKVSYFRRFCAFCFDIVFVLILAILIPVDTFFIKYVISILCYFVIMTYLTHGETIGKWIVKIRLVSLEGEKPDIHMLLIRYGLLYLIFIPAPFYCLYLLSITGTLDFSSNITLFFVVIALAILYAIFCFHTFVTIIEKKNLLLYEKYSKTKHISTIQLPKKEEKITEE